MNGQHYDAMHHRLGGDLNEVYCVGCDCAMSLVAWHAHYARCQMYVDIDLGSLISRDGV